MNKLAAAVLAIVLAITYWAFTRVPESIPNKFPVRSSSSSLMTVLEEEELDLPVSKTYKASSSVSIEPIIEEKAWRPKFIPHFKSSSSRSSSSVETVSSSSSKSAFCTDESYLDSYSDPASKEAAKRARNKFCR